MREYLAKGGKLALTAILWVFILSITVNGRPLFHYANDFFVQNSIVAAIDEELSNLWHRVSETARITYDKVTAREEKA